MTELNMLPGKYCTWMNMHMNDKQGHMALPQAHCLVPSYTNINTVNMALLWKTTDTRFVSILNVSGLGKKNLIEDNLLSQMLTYASVPLRQRWKFIGLNEMCPVKQKDKYMASLQMDFGCIPWAAASRPTKSLCWHQVPYGDGTEAGYQVLPTQSKYKHCTL